MKVAIAAGGTAGHINPAIALADELISRGHEVVFYGTPDKLESKIVPQAGYRIIEVNAAGFNRSKPWTLITSSITVLSSSHLVRRSFAQENPDVAIGFGAYVEVPLALAAHKQHISFAIHEQNSVPGMANLQMAKIARLIALSYPSTRAAFAQKTRSAARIVETGNPVRRSVLEADRNRGRDALDIPYDARVLTVFGGSLGAQAINDAITGAAKQMLSERDDLYIVHSTGVKDLEGVLEAHDKLPTDLAFRWKVFPYIDGMGDVIAASDLLFSRAGASSLAEITAIGIPAVLVPYPFARGDHQRLNAEFLVEKDAAVLIPNDKLDPDAILLKVAPLLDNEAELARIRTNIQKLAGGEAAVRLADELESLVSL